MAGGFPVRARRRPGASRSTRGPTIAFDPPGVLIPARPLARARRHPRARRNPDRERTARTRPGRPLPDCLDDPPDGRGHARRYRHAPQHEHQAGLDLDEAAHAGAPDPRGARHLERVGQRPAAPGRARPGRPGEDQRRRARREGGGRHRRLECARPARARDRRGPAALRPPGRRTHPAREGRASHRPPRRLQRPHAAWAWAHGHRDEVVQTADGQKDGGYGGFTNFANPIVRRYQVDIAVAAAMAGVDEILYDYVRRPDGPLSSMVFPGLKGAPDDAIASFLADTQTALKPYGTYLGASVFGVAATRPDEVAQNIPKMAEHLDYVSAMVYPSHWAPGEYGSPTRTASRTRSSSARSRTSRRTSAAPAPVSSRGCRTSRSAPTTGLPRSPPRSRRRRTTGSTSSCSGTRGHSTPARHSPRMREPPSFKPKTRRRLAKA